MRKRKILFTALAVVLVCSISVVGTLAFLQKESNGVTNTFTAAPDLCGSFVLDESQAIQNNDGSYTLNPSARVQANTYVLAPGVTYEKDPTVTITGKTETAAYLYLAVLDGKPATVQYTIDSKWVQMGTITKDSETYDLYYYDANGDGADLIVSDSDATLTYNVLTNNQFQTTSQFTPDTAQFTLTCYAYLAQASAGTDAATAYAACFGAFTP